MNYLKYLNYNIQFGEKKSHLLIFVNLHSIKFNKKNPNDNDED